MGLWKSLRQMLGQKPVPPAVPLPPPPPVDDLPEPNVPEWSVAQFKLALAEPNPPLVLDVREGYEWRQVHMPFARHVPMNEVPQHLDELQEAVARRGTATPAVVVVCAHGSRSYSVAAWLNDQDIPAASLDGGITQWSIQGGEVAQGQ
jgi:rhodanese-related sulfurtransferase